jgi:hypothetical protein
MVDLPFTGGFYSSKATPLSSQICVNWYVNVNEAGALNQENLFGSAGIELVDAGQPLESNRGSHEMAGVPFFVNGNTLYRVVRTVDEANIETLTVESLGTIEGTGRVSMADNGLQLCIVVPAGKAYIFDGTLNEITDPDFNGPAETVVFVDGYFVFNKTNSNVIFHSELRDGTNYNALDFGEAESDPDNIVALHVDRNTLYAIGTETIEPFQNVGGTAFVFAPIRGGVISKGLRSRFLVYDNSYGFIFIGKGEEETLAVWWFNGGNVTKISTVPVDELLGQATQEQLEEGFSFYHSIDGAQFWGLTVGNTTLIYDSLASSIAGRKIWHERSSRVEGLDIQWRASTIVSAYNRLFVGDLFDGRIGVLKSGVRREYGSVIIRKCSTQPFDGGPYRVSELEPRMVSGSGTYELDPLLGMSYSDNGGRTFSEMTFRGLGKAGDYKRRTIWRRLGRVPKQRVLMFQFSEDSDPSFLKLEAKTA